MPSSNGARPEAPGGGHSTQLVEPNDTPPAELPPEFREEAPPRPPEPDRPEPPPPPEPETAPPVPEPAAVELDEFAVFPLPPADAALLLAPFEVVAGAVGVVLIDWVALVPVAGSTTALPLAGNPPRSEALPTSPAVERAVCAEAGNAAASTKKPNTAI